MDTIRRRLVLGAGPALMAGPVLAREAGLPPGQSADHPLATPAMERTYRDPVTRRPDMDEDLTQVARHARRASGEVIDIAGTVLAADGRTPVAGAVIAVWQACSNGADAVPDAPFSRTADRNFQGYARLLADRHGRFRFRTVRPGVVAGRAPHIQFEVTAPGRAPAAGLVTQMYFAGDPRNETDRLLQALSDPQARRRALAVPVRGVPPGDPPLYFYPLVLPAASAV